MNRTIIKNKLEKVSKKNGKMTKSWGWKIIDRKIDEKMVRNLQKNERKLPEIEGKKLCKIKKYRGKTF